jgi:hypothetical protein
MASFLIRHCEEAFIPRISVKSPPKILAFRPFKLFVLVHREGAKSAKKGLSLVTIKPKGVSGEKGTRHQIALFSSCLRHESLE